MSVIQEEEVPESYDSSTWQANQCRSALLLLAQKAYDQGYNALVTVKGYSGIPISPDRDLYEFLVSGIPAVVMSEDEVTVLAPPKPKVPNSSQMQRDKSGTEYALPKKKPPQKRSRQNGIHLEDVSGGSNDKVEWQLIQFPLQFYH